jgi:hypothetical protein
VQAGEVDSKEVEPPVPPGLGQLSASLDSLADFLRIDGDLLHVAAKASSPLSDLALDRDEFLAWLGTLASAEKDELITKLVVESDQAAVTELRQRFLRQRCAAGAGPITTDRTVGQLLAAAAAYARQRKHIEAEKQAAEKMRREQEAAVARRSTWTVSSGAKPDCGTKSKRSSPPRRRRAMIRPCGTWSTCETSLRAAAAATFGCASSRYVRRTRASPPSSNGSTRRACNGLP